MKFPKPKFLKSYEKEMRYMLLICLLIYSITVLYGNITPSITTSLAGSDKNADQEKYKPPPSFEYDEGKVPFCIIHLIFFNTYLLGISRSISLAVFWKIVDLKTMGSYQSNVGGCLNLATLFIKILRPLSFHRNSFNFCLSEISCFTLCRSQSQKR